MVHFHAVIRLDAPGEDYRPPPPHRASLLCDAVGQAAAAVRLVVDHGGQAVTLGLRPADRRPAHPAATRSVGTGRPLDAEAVANYIAKYATKTLTAPGVPDARLRHQPRSLSCAARLTTGR